MSSGACMMVPVTALSLGTLLFLVTARASHRRRAAFGELVSEL
jgi:hypothetical protein